MAYKRNWIRWFLTLALGWQLLGLAAPAYADTVYTIQPGDTLYLISLRFGVSLPALIAANNLATANLIYPGQQLVIPDAGPAATPPPAAAATPAPTPAPAVTIYIVRPGDYLHHIATQFGVSEQSIIAANGLANANWLIAGQRLMIPAGDVVPTPAPPPAATDVTPAPPSPNAASTAPASADSNSGNIVYVVKVGDTLWGITRRFKVSLETLKSFNQLYSDNIHVGQSLIIPGPGATPVAPPTVEAWPPATLPAWIPAMSWHALDLYVRGIALGHNRNAFSVAGDCNSDYAIYMGPVATGVVDLSSFLYLKNTVSKFWESIRRPSLAVHGGYNARSMMDPLWANPAYCQPGESPLACELRVNNSSIVFIALGTGDQFAWRDFEKNYRKIIDYTIGQSVLPVLVTKADRLEFQQGGAEQQFINSVIRRLGQEYDVPVLDLWLAVQGLPNGGLVWEGGQDFHLSNEGNTRHNLSTLQTLDVIWRKYP